MQRRTRIVVTLGPACDRPGVLTGVIGAGLNVARINLSHGTAEEHAERIGRLREAAGGRAIALLADLPGPKLRVLLDGPVELRVDQEVGISTGSRRLADSPLGLEIVVTEPEALRDVQPGQRVLLDDGRLQLRIVCAEETRLRANVLVGGTLAPNKGINLPDSVLRIPAVTERDREALRIAAAAKADWLALSFVRGPGAAAELRSAAKALGLDVPVLAKIERPEAVEQAAEIVDAFDGIMVARGDLGVEIALERVPFVQKTLIALARSAGKPVITATDMLDSMRGNPRPTRAEVSDVANAIYDGTDAVMLSGETAMGQFPVEAVTCMERIACETETHLAHGDRHEVLVPRAEIDDHITHATCALASEVSADAIITPTLTGRTARLVARHRPQATIVAPVPRAEIGRQLALVWGVLPVLLPQKLQPGQDRIEVAVRAAFERRAVTAGQLAVVLAGHPIEGGERLPTLRVVRIAQGGRATAP